MMKIRDFRLYMKKLAGENKNKIFSDSIYLNIKSFNVLYLIIQNVFYFLSNFSLISNK